MSRQTTGPRRRHRCQTFLHHVPFLLPSPSLNTRQIPAPTTRRLYRQTCPATMDGLPLEPTTFFRSSPSSSSLPYQPHPSHTLTSSHNVSSQLFTTRSRRPPSFFGCHSFSFPFLSLPLRHQRQFTSQGPLPLSSSRTDQEDETRLIQQSLEADQRWRRLWQAALDKKDIGQLLHFWHQASLFSILQEDTQNSKGRDNSPESHAHLHCRSLDSLHVGQLAAFFALLRIKQKAPAIRHAALFHQTLHEMTSWFKQKTPKSSLLLQQPSTLADLLSLYARAKNLPDALHLLHIASEANHPLTASMTRTKQTQSHALLLSMYHHPVVLDSLIRLCWHTNEHVLGLAILRHQMTSANIDTLTDTCWGFLLSVLIARKQLITARQVEQFLFHHCPSRLTNGFFGWVMHAYARKGNARDTARLFQRANDVLGTSLDITCLNALLRAFAISGDAYRMEQIWKVIHARRLTPDLTSFTIFLHGYLVSQQPRMLDVLEREMVAQQTQGTQSIPMLQKERNLFGSTDHIWLHNQWRALVEAEEWTKAHHLFKRHWARDAPEPMQFNWYIYASCVQLIKTLKWPEAIQAETEPILAALYDLIRQKVENMAASGWSDPITTASTSSQRRSKMPGPHTTSATKNWMDAYLPSAWQAYNTHQNLNWFIDWGAKMKKES